MGIRWGCQMEIKRASESRKREMQIKRSTSRFSGRVGFLGMGSWQVLASMDGPPPPSSTSNLAVVPVPWECVLGTAVGELGRRGGLPLPLLCSSSLCSVLTGAGVADMARHGQAWQWKRGRHILAVFGAQCYPPGRGVTGLNGVPLEWQVASDRCGWLKWQ